MDETTATARYAKFTAAPFQSGFGQTLGNSLRRVLLSSMEGSAISALRIDGASREFASLPNVVEDITDIVLNLKNVRLCLHGDVEKTLEIRKDKAGKVTAGDIITDGTVEVLNPEQVICTLDKNMPFRAEIDVVKGKGYLPVEKAGAARSIGTIPIDCLFSPVTHVNYHVGAAVSVKRPKWTVWLLRSGPMAASLRKLRWKMPRRSSKITCRFSWAVSPLRKMPAR
jgi:DNA-directed RNA polymerase subunit alpha